MNNTDPPSPHSLDTEQAVSSCILSITYLFLLEIVLFLRSLGALKPNGLALLVEQAFLVQSTAHNAWSVAHLSVNESAHRPSVLHWNDVLVERRRQS